MSATLPEHSLHEKRYVTVVLRLLVDGRNELLDGQVVGGDGVLGGRFVDWLGLTPAVRAWLSTSDRENF